MAKWVCSVCGYVHEGDEAPEVCPVCKAPASKFIKQDAEMTWAAEHVVGVAKGVSEDILEDLRANFQGECSEVGMYLAMARVAHREGYPEVGLYYEKAANIKSGSGVPNKTKVAKVTKAQVQEIAELKMKDLNAASLEAAMSMIAGTARSMGIEVVD